jgi:hypothetical protein
LKKGINEMSKKEKFDKKCEEVTEKLEGFDRDLDKFWWGEGAGTRWCYIFAACGLGASLFHPDVEFVAVIFLVGLPLLLAQCLERGVHKVRILSYFFYLGAVMMFLSAAGDLFRADFGMMFENMLGGLFVGGLGWVIGKRAEKDE